DPDAWEAHCNLAIVMQALKRLDQAAAGYERALELSADNVQCLINLGVCRVDQDNPVAGEAQIRHAIAVDSDRARAWANLGVALARQDRNDEAFHAFQRAGRLGGQRGGWGEGFVNFA